MDAWLKAGIDYAGLWIDYQMRQLELPGCAVAIAHKGKIVSEQAFGLANLARREVLTPRHRFRIASLSKTFTAVGILKLKEAGRLRLDDQAGAYVDGLHPAVAKVTLAQLLSHSSGLSRDGDNSGYFADQIPFPTAQELIKELCKEPPIGPAVRFKYSNNGYGLLGLIIEAVTGEAYDTWITREIVSAATLGETTPDMPGAGVPFASGHSSRLPLGQRVVIPGENATNAFSSVTGFTSTAADMALFYAQLSPAAPKSILSIETRRDMTRPHWRDLDSAVGRSYGLGVHVGQLGGWEYFGHVGRFQGSVTRVVVVPHMDLAITVFANAIDGPALPWLDGVLHILQRFHSSGVPSGFAADWTGRWWNMWGATDLVALGERVYAFSPAVFPPFAEASEISLSESDTGRVTRAPAMERFGEPVQRVRDREGRVAAIRIGGTGMISEERLKPQLLARYADSTEAESAKHPSAEGAN